MSITDELREFIDSLACHKDTRDMMRRIADRIDKEHAEAVADALQLRGEPDRWVELPTDADGVPIHVGDVMEFSRFDVSYNPAVKVDGIGAGVFFSFDEKLGRFAQKDANAYRHVQPDSWERIISDAVILGRQLEWADNSRGDADSERELVERCRRLAGDAE